MVLESEFEGRQCKSIPTYKSTEPSDPGGVTHGNPEAVDATSDSAVASSQILTPMTDRCGFFLVFGDRLAQMCLGI